MGNRIKLRGASRVTDVVTAERGGFALVPALILASLLAVLGLSMLMSHLSGARVVNSQGDEYGLKSAMESVANLASERIWSGYLASQDSGKAGSIASFQAYLDTLALPHEAATVPPGVEAGVSFLPQIQLPSDGEGDALFGDVHVEALRVYRHDDAAADATSLFVTVVARTDHGNSVTRPPLRRQLQLVYTIQPEQFDGFDYGVLANNVNCIFCHSVFDSADRYWNGSPDAYGTFERIKVGMLESLAIRDDGDHTSNITDADADSYIAGSLYVRGHALDHEGNPISDWSAQTLSSFEFGPDGLLLQDLTGDLTPTSFSPAGDPPQPGENLYLDYPLDYADMVDGGLPTSFPPPFPDDGGIDPNTGEPAPGAAGNHVVDPSEFWALAEGMEGGIEGGAIQVTDPGDQIGGLAELQAALATGNALSLTSGMTANVMLTGTLENPIQIDGDVAIQGDLVINGYIQGEGTLYVSGNVYVPAGLQYLDGNVINDDGSSGPRTFGVAPDGTLNALGLAAGGNILVGDFMKPSVDLDPGPNDIVTGGPDGPFNFALAELALFNRGQWAQTQVFLPAQGEDTSDPSSWTVVNPTNVTHQFLPAPGEDPQDPESWTLFNPSYDPSFMPRYYEFGAGDAIPVYNKGNLWFDAQSATWHGDTEVPTTWDPDLLSMWDPADTGNPALYDGSGQPVAAISQLGTEGDWLSDQLLKAAIEHLEGLAPEGPMAIDGLLYTNNAIFGIVHRGDTFQGQLEVNGALVCADLGLLAPGYRNTAGMGTDANPPGSPWAVGLRLNYDRRLRDSLNVQNPNAVMITRALWNPASDAL